MSSHRRLAMQASALGAAPGPLPTATQGGVVVTIAGFASLMDEASARETTPSITNWRYGWAEGWCRVFNLVSILNIRRGFATGERLVTCTARPRPASRLRVCLYDVPAAEYPELLARERRLREATTRYTTDGGEEGEAVIFAEYSDEAYRRERANTAELWHEEVGQWYDGEKIYRDDLLPVPRYLERCLAAFHALGPCDPPTRAHCRLFATTDESLLLLSLEQQGEPVQLLGREFPRGRRDEHQRLYRTGRRRAPGPKRQ